MTAPRRRSTHPPRICVVSHTNKFTNWQMKERPERGRQISQLQEDLGIGSCFLTLGTFVCLFRLLVRSSSLLPRPVSPPLPLPAFVPCSCFPKTSLLLLLLSPSFSTCCRGGGARAAPRRARGASSSSAGGGASRPLVGRTQVVWESIRSNRSIIEICHNMPPHQCAPTILSTSRRSPSIDDRSIDRPVFSAHLFNQWAVGCGFFEIPSRNNPLRRCWVGVGQIIPGQGACNEREDYSAWPRSIGASPAAVLPVIFLTRQ